MSIHSSYKENNYGLVFELLIKQYNPLRVVELGSLEGYSSIHILNSVSGGAHVDFYDLWEDYSYKSCTLDQFKKNLSLYSNNSSYRCISGDAFSAYSNYEDESVDFLHVDLSNDADKLFKIYEQWFSKLKLGGVFVFEGGSADRDSVEWMEKYNRRPIKEFIESEKFSTNFSHYVLNPHPSITVATKIKK